MSDNAPERLIARGALVVEQNHLAWVGAIDELPDEFRQAATTEIDVAGALVTPGLIDCHSHLVYAGQRAREFESRLQGLSYEEIARAGGGICATVQATRSADDQQLYAQTAARLQTMISQGVTTIEIKSGYGLSRDQEARMLRIARKLGDDHAVGVRTSYLAAHALAPEYEGRADAYIEAVCEWLPQLHAQGLIDAVDVFCDKIGFSLSQTRRVFDAARALHLPLHLHAEQLSNQHGAALAARLGALSCDHLEFLDEAGVQTMAAHGTVAVLLPGAFYFLRQTQLPPVQQLRAAGVPIAVATDHNPGTSPVLSPLLVLNMACVLFGLTPWEALRGATANAARALGLHSTHGSLTAGRRADFVVWDAAHPSELAYYVG
ncbi:MAG TPA: imidazolonepropionase, partial [Burkholderiaceae bacterium]|nr:imidazolonepropionase [Burkholderiaceae bacterium]